MTDASLQELKETAERAARAAGRELSQRGVGLLEIAESHRRDLKLAADKASESLILDALGGTGIPILSEEDGLSGDAGRTEMWVVDPLDGTVNFAKNLPSCCVSIALAVARKPVVGVIYDFNRDEMFSGVAGIGATCNGAPITVSDVDTPDRAMLATGLPPARDFSPKAMADVARQLAGFMKVRMLGSAALSLAYVACGRADLYHEDGVMPWDVAAGMALVRAASGDARWSSDDMSGPVSATAGNPALMKAVAF